MASLTPPPVAAPTPLRPVAATVGGREPTVQRLGNGSSIGALAAAAATTVASTLGRIRSPRGHRTDPAVPANPSSGDALPSYSLTDNAASAHSTLAQADPLPEYTAIPAGGFDPRVLNDFQLDELVHRIIGRITRLVRTELRLDRERIGRLRDPRH